MPIPTEPENMIQLRNSSRFWPRLFLGITTILFSMLAQGDSVYKCQETSAQGEQLTVFSATPCASDAEKITVHNSKPSTSGDSRTAEEIVGDLCGAARELAETIMRAYQNGATNAQIAEAARNSGTFNDQAIPLMTFVSQYQHSGLTPDWVGELAAQECMKGRFD